MNHAKQIHVPSMINHNGIDDVNHIHYHVYKLHNALSCIMFNV